MNRSMVLGVALLAVAAAACQKQEAKSDPAAVKSAIEADQKKWNDDFKAKNLEGLLSHYAGDAHFVADGTVADGATAIRKAYADALSDAYFGVTFASDKVDVASSGDLAYARGHFTEKHEDRKTAQIVSESGTYVTVYKKQPDGSWKAVEDVSVGDPATRKTSPVVVTGPKMISF
jgi:uncharacterized protein (TIGR02246 family)